MSDSTPTAAQLFSSLEKGDYATCARLLARYSDWLNLLARLQIDRRFQGKFDAADIAQTTLLEAYQACPRFRGRSEGELLAWLRQILAHVLSHEVRRYLGTQQRDATREVSIEADLAQSSQGLARLMADSGPSPSALAVAKERELMLADALARLAPEHREVIVLRNLLELPYEEIATRMEKNPGAVRMLWTRALVKLREELQSQISGSG